MPFKYVPLNQLGKDLILNKDLFESAFPEEERPPFETVLTWNRDTFYGVYDEDKHIGLAYLIEFEEFAYLFFFAVEPSYRNKGIGTKILSELKAKYAGKRMFLLADEPGEQYKDQALRLRRLGFYARNGFVDTELVITEFGVRYHLLSLGGAPISKCDFLRVMESLIGETMVKTYYGDI